MKRKALLVVAMMVVVATLFATAAKADRRVALVIGNSVYKNATQLPNTINDANAVAALFRSVGFEVVNSRTDLGVLEFKRAVRDFLITAESADIAVVYYAGHGIEVNGTNYLIPADAKLARDYDVEDEAVALDRIIWALQSVKRLRLILLDACRDNPFVAKLRSVFTRAAPKGGLAKIEDVSADTLVAYAAKAGSFSYDGDGPNSPFATALIRHVAEPGLDIRIALGRVRDEVLKATGGRQEPFIYGSLGGATIPLVPAPKKIEPAQPALAVAARESAAPAKPNASLSPVEPNRVEKLAPAVGDAAPAKVEPPKPPQPTVQAALEKEDPARACIRDEQRLAQLRSNPVTDEIARFQRDLACTRLHAQVQRLFESVAAAQPASAPLAPREPAAPAKPNASLWPVEPNRVEKLAPAVGNAAPAKVEPLKPPQPTVQAALEKDDPARACIRDEQRLAQLRSNPVPDEIARFQRDLACTRLHAQVQRLFESAAAAQPASAPLAPPPPISAPPSRPAEAVAGREPGSRPNAANSRSGQVERSAPTPGDAVPADIEPSKGSHAAADSNDPALACRRDELRLTQLRSNPVPEEIARFQRELSCRQLHAQVQRLFESVATGPPASAPRLESAIPAEAIRRSEPVPGMDVRRQAQAPPAGPTSSCARDAERLARLREDPTLEAIARFERELGCERLRPQLRRLRESVGQ